MVDDQMINLTVIKNFMNELCLQNRCVYFHDGQEIIDAVIKKVETYIDQFTSLTPELRPISLMLIDF